MQLSTYLQRYQVTRSQFAEIVGVSAVTVWRWANGQRFPAGHLSAIARATGGKVTANDFAKLREGQA